MEIILSAVDKGGEFSIPHDLNFHTTRYETKHTIVSSAAREPSYRNALLIWALVAVSVDNQESQAGTFGCVEGIRSYARR